MSRFLFLLLFTLISTNANASLPYEKDSFYYHPNHLGSTSYVTDEAGEIFQHIEYFPSGETWIEEHSNRQRTPYLFTAKELDEETGLYYFGARYYDPRTSVWQNPDPILNSYLDGFNGGVYNPVNLNLYNYAGQNPIKFVDHDGNFFIMHQRYLYDTGQITKGHMHQLNQVTLTNYAIVEAGIKTGGAVGFEAATFSLPMPSPAKLKIARWASKSKIGGALKNKIASLIGLGVKGKLTPSQMKTAFETAQKSYKGTTKVGHALAKHAGRNPKTWGKLTGSMKTFNKKAMKHFQDIISGPGGFKEVKSNGVKFLEKRLDDGRGVRLNMDHTFKTFLD